MVTVVRETFLSYEISIRCLLQLYSENLPTPFVELDYRSLLFIYTHIYN